MDHKLIYLARRNPAIAPEDWPRAWRSHAVFASQFPVLGARISSLVYCARALTPVDPPGVSPDYDGVAIVASPSADSLDGEMSPADRARILADELRVFAENTPAFSFHAKETVAQGGPPGGAAVIRFLARRPEMSADAFQARWTGPHAEIALRCAEAAGYVVRYAQNVFTAPPPPSYPFEGVAETWTATPEEAARAMVDPAFAPLTEDLAAFCDLSRSVALVTRVIHRWPRG